MGDEERKVVGEIVASGMPVAQWCAVTGKMGTTKAYRILNWFRENDPSAFGAGEEAARRPGGGAWFERVRSAIAADQAGGVGDRAIDAQVQTEAMADGTLDDAVAGDHGAESDDGAEREPAASPETTVVGRPDAMPRPMAVASAPRPVATGSFALVDASELLAPRTAARASPAITVEAMGVTVTLPAGSAAPDVAAAVSATLAALGVGA